MQFLNDVVLLWDGSALLSDRYGSTNLRILMDGFSKDANVFTGLNVFVVDFDFVVVVLSSKLIIIDLTHVNLSC